jgi:hypothetical protein
MYFENDFSCKLPSISTCHFSCDLHVRRCESNDVSPDLFSRERGKVSVCLMSGAVEVEGRV